MPCIGDEPLPSMSVRVNGTEQVILGRVPVTGEVEKTGRAMVCNATLVVNLEAHEAPCHAVVISMGAVAILAG